MNPYQNTKWTRTIPALALLLGLLSCAPPPERTPQPTPQWLVVYTSPAWQPLSQPLAACLAPGQALAYAADPAQAGVNLTWGETILEGYEAYELGSEELVVIVHPDNPIPELSLEALRLVYQGEINDWDFLGVPPAPLTAWAYPAGDETSLVASAVLDISPEVQIAPAPEQMRQAVAADLHAIGLLPRRMLDDSVRELPISGLPAGVMRAPLLAQTEAEPNAEQRAWLFCLQEKLAP